ncbi:hypothetical protein R1sor_009671 [Riccia sorocarpa]|uniref:Uncharacterized protein n=1 Tax=Riccia sorocarpa TaxID=122646 RepID=A0ABD3HVQ7_9MARC
MSLKLDGKESGGRNVKFVKVESPGSMLEKSQSLPDKSSGLATEACPKTDNGKFTTPESKKFSSSVHSFFKSNSESQDQAKKSSLTQEEGGKSKKSHAQPRSKGDRKSKEQPSSTFRDLPSRREEEKVSKTHKSSQDTVVREKSVHQHTPQSWFIGFNNGSQTGLRVNGTFIQEATPQASYNGLEENTIREVTPQTWYAGFLLLLLLLCCNAFEACGVILSWVGFALPAGATPHTWYAGVSYDAMVTPHSNEPQTEPESMSHLLKNSIEKNSPKAKSEELILSRSAWKRVEHLDLRILRRRGKKEEKMSEVDVLIVD